MKAPEFYRVLAKFQDVLKNAGFSKRANNTYTTNNNVRLRFILNKWGWSPDDGWGFLVRLADLTYTDEYGNIVGIGGEYDITPRRLIDTGLISEEKLLLLYKETPHLKRQLNLGWFAFNDETDLQDMLSVLLPLIASAASVWAAGREVARKQPKEVRKMTETTREKTRQDLEDLLS